ncbi:hypothetical protein DRQ33_06890 [bacterium]|nr:MAG: hypothetical protein DRQ33_06890 [bacterium]
MTPFSYEKYLKSEISLLPDRSKKWSIRSAAVYPNDYPTAMSNLGFLSLFQIMHRFPQLYPQRFFGTRPVALETNEKLASFPLIAVSISYEPDILNLLKMLNKSGIPIYAPQREKRLIIAGGSAITINPFPISSIADVIFLGEGISFITQIIEILANNPPGIVDKNDLLCELDKIPGVWIPQLNHEPPPRAISEDDIPPSSSIVSSLASFPNMALVQIQRGCPFRCPFCATPVIYNPFVNYSLNSIIENISHWNKLVSRIGLVGSAIADFHKLAELVEILQSKKFEIFTSSIRLDRLTPELIDILKITNRRTLTFAPETLSDMLCDKIGKKITGEEIVNTAGQFPVDEIKLYYIVGLPGEEISDVKMIAEQLKYIANKLTDKRIIASVNPFIPKRGTIWGEKPMMGHRQLMERFYIINNSVANLKNVHIQVNYRRKTRLQWALSTGGKEIAEILAVEQNVSAIVRKLKQKGWDI